MSCACDAKRRSTLQNVCERLRWRKTQQRSSRLLHTPRKAMPFYGLRWALWLVQDPPKDPCAPCKSKCIQWHQAPCLVPHTHTHTHAHARWCQMSSPASFASPHSHSHSMASSPALWGAPDPKLSAAGRARTPAVWGAPDPNSMRAPRFSAKCEIKCQRERERASIKCQIECQIKCDIKKQTLFQKICQMANKFTNWI